MALPSKKQIWVVGIHTSTRWHYAVIHFGTKLARSYSVVLFPPANKLCLRAKMFFVRRKLIETCAALTSYVTLEGKEVIGMHN